MKYRGVLDPSEEGLAAFGPALPGCWSQGSTEAEAMDNIRDAIRLCLEVAEEDAMHPEDGLAIAAEVTV